jgi:FMN phosphatase YigB (HAD superfamily)
MIEIHSFDVFDTCLTRTYDRPHDLFLELARSVLAHSGDGEDEVAVRLLARQRQIAELHAREHSASEDILLHDIYVQLSNYREITFNPDIMLKKEMELELKSVVPIKETFTLYESIRKKSHRIIFISDMYLPEELVIAMLSRCGYFANASNLYISGKIGLTKRSGNLYNHVLGAEGATPSNLTHYGDNKVSDIKMANALGIKTVHLPAPTQQTKYEEVFSHKNSSWHRVSDTLQKYSRHFRRIYKDPLSDVSVSKHIALSKTNAISRILLRNLSQENSNDRDLFAIGYFVAAPLFVSFVIWLLQAAQEQKIARLYFVARNGQVFHNLANIICKHLGYNIECRYLYGSRAAWYPSSFESFDKNFIDFLLKKYPNRNVREIFEDLSFSKEHVTILLAALAESKYDLEESKDAETVNGLLNLLMDSEYNKLVCEHFESCWNNIVDYLSQEHFFDPGNVGIVDIGWSLSSHNALHRIVEKVNDRGFSGFYFGVGKNRQEVAKNAPYHYFFSDIDSAKRSWLFKLGPMSLLEEVFSAADHPTTSGYQRINGKVFPVMNKTSFPGVSSIASGITDSMVDYTKFLIDTDHLLDLQLVKDEALEQLERMYKYPTENEASAIADTPIFALTSHSHSQRRTLARAIETHELLDIVTRVTFSNRDFYPDWVWLQGSMAISNRFVAKAGKLLSFFESYRLTFRK